MSLLDPSDLLGAISTERQRQEPDQDVIGRFRSDDSLEVPIELTDLELWGNYMSEDLYEMDKKVREFLKKTRYKRRVKNGYRTTVPMVFAWIFGRQPSPGDGSVCRLLHTLMKYYCTSYTGASTFMGKPVNRVYRFSQYACNQKRPYSLRLRLEEAKDDDTDGIFRNSPGQNADKRSYGRRANRPDGEREAR